MKPDSEKIVYQYKIEKWNNLAELQALLELMTNAGWRVDNHHLGKNDSGWTIFTQATFINPPLLQRKIGLTELYRIVNNVLEPGTDIAREFDKAIKDSVRVEGDTF